MSNLSPPSAHRHVEIWHKTVSAAQQGAPVGNCLSAPRLPAMWEFAVPSSITGRQNFSTIGAATIDWTRFGTIGLVRARQMKATGRGVICIGVVPPSQPGYGIKGSPNQAEPLVNAVRSMSEDRAHIRQCCRLTCGLLQSISSA